MELVGLVEAKERIPTGKWEVITHDEYMKQDITSWVKKYNEICSGLTYKQTRTMINWWINGGYRSEDYIVTLKNVKRDMNE